MSIFDKIKKQARKLMPKELSGIAQLAAPFVGANNALYGAGLSFLGQARSGEGKINPLKIAMSAAPGLRFQGGTGLDQFKLTGYKGGTGYRKNSLRDLFLRGERDMIGEDDAEGFIDNLISEAEDGNVEAQNHPLYKLAIKRGYDGTTRFSTSSMSEGTDPIFKGIGKTADKFLFGGYDQGKKEIAGEPYSVPRKTKAGKIIPGEFRNVTPMKTVDTYTPKAGLFGEGGKDFTLGGLKDSAISNALFRTGSPFDLLDKTTGKRNPLSMLKLGSEALTIYSFLDARKEIKTAEEAAAAVEAQMLADGITDQNLIDAATTEAVNIFSQLSLADFNLANGGRIGFARGTPEEGIGSLDTGAESIMYEGTDGARSPEQTENEQQNLQAMGIPRGLSLEDAIKTFKMSIGRDPKGIEEVLEFFKNRKVSGGQPLPEDPTKPINPFGPKPMKDGITQMAAAGGRMGFMYGSDMGGMGGLSSLQTQPSDVTPPGMELDLRGGGFIPIGKAEKADDVPARVSKNEFVFTADAVKAAGGGSVNEGAKKMYDTMKQLESQVG